MGCCINKDEREQFRPGTYKCAMPVASILPTKKTVKRHLRQHCPPLMHPPQGELLFFSHLK